MSSGSNHHVDWRVELRALAAVGKTEQFPLLVYEVRPASREPWPVELAEPSASVLEFYRLCDGGYLGGHHQWIAVGELLTENRRWWDLADGRTWTADSPIHPHRHVILAYDCGGFPLVWDQRTDQLLTYYFKDSDDLEHQGPTIDELMTRIFDPSYQDDLWQEALGQLRSTTRD
jgi:hypothetical protein